jgi:di/tricarboxylate transporter
MWIFGGHYVEATTAALIVLVLMLMTGVVTWNDVAANKAAWTTLSLLALLVTLASGLSRVGFVKWFADYVATHMGGLSPTLSLVALVSIYFFSHYMFASITAHTTAMLPVMLAVGMAVPGLPVATLATALAGVALVLLRRGRRDGARELLLTELRRDPDHLTLLDVRAVDREVGQHLEAGVWHGRRS